MNRLLVALAATLLITSPALAHPREITQADLAALKPGVATYADTVAALGHPSSEMLDSAGKRTIAYVTMRTRVKAATFIPYVGLFAGGATSDVSVVSLSFGPDGHLLSYQSTSSQTDCSSNVFGPTCRGGEAAMPVAPAPAQTPAVAPEPATPEPAANSAG